MVVDTSIVSGKLNTRIPMFISRSKPRRTGGVVSLMKAVAWRASVEDISATGLAFISAIEDGSILMKDVAVLVKSCSSCLMAFRSSRVRMILI